MKKVIILQNSNLSFGLDAYKIYQPDNYQLHLIINDYGYKIVIEKQQQKYYKKIICTNDFSFTHLLSLIEKCISNKTDFIIVTNAEEAMPVCGQLRKYFGLDQNDYSAFYDKHVMKQRLSTKCDILFPRYQLFEPQQYSQRGTAYLQTILNVLRFPLFAKPINACGSVNLRKINTMDKFEKWAKSVRPQDRYELDEFIDGVMYHCDSYIKNGKILFTLVSKNSRPCYDFTVGKMKGTIVLPKDHPDTIRLSQFTQNVLQQLGMPKGGVTHLELIKTVSDELYFIEIAHRSPGCLIPKMYFHHAGIDTISSHFLLQIDPDFSTHLHHRTYAAWACYPKKPGIVTALRSLPKHYQSQCELQWQTQVGDVVAEYSQFGRDYLGSIFMTHANFSTLHEEFLAVNNDNLCEITAQVAIRN